MEISKEKIIKIALPLLVLLGGGIFFNRQQTETTETNESFWASTAASSQTIQSADNVLYADIKGAVVKPGMYRFEEGDRLIDLINTAGGFHQEADQSQVNLAKRIQDQEVVYVPKQGEAMEQQPIVSQINENEPAKININQADEKQLQELSGIGEKKAQDIIQYREQHGSFKSIDDLINVSGIGEKTLDKLRDSITI